MWKMQSLVIKTHIEYGNKPQNIIIMTFYLGIKMKKKMHKKTIILTAVKVVSSCVIKY